MYKLRAYVHILSVHFYIMFVCVALKGFGPVFAMAQGATRLNKYGWRVQGAIGLLARGASC